MSWKICENCGESFPEDFIVPVTDRQRLECHGALCVMEQEEEECPFCTSSMMHEATEQELEDE